MSNKAIIAAAGSGKTTHLVEWAVSLPRSSRIVLTTYTINNAAEARRKFIEQVGRVPENVEIIPWMTLLMRHGARPYHSAVLDDINSVSGLNTERLTPKQKGYPRKDDPRRYYCDATGRVYSDLLAEFVLLLDESTGGAVIRRLSDLFDYVFFDEIQDISGRDFEVLELILRCETLRTVVVGDPRQGTFSTTKSRTNKKLTRSNIVAWIELMEKAQLLTIDRFDFSRRSNKEICDLGDSIYPTTSYPTLSRTTSHLSEQTDHDGVFLVKSAHVMAYAKTFEPQLLTWNRKAQSFGLDGRNMGEVKGLTFDRVLINPTGPMLKFLTADGDLVDEARAKLYVASTRARFSVAFITDDPGACTYPYWYPTDEQARSD